MSSPFHALAVAETYAETDQAISIVLDIPNRISEAFRWRAGQHVTLRFDIDGEEVRRSYSISQTPVSGDPLRITVKRVKGGLVSNYINDHITPDMTVDVMAPFGSFCLDPDHKARRTHYFFAAGSGITPLYAMTRSVLEAEPHSVAHLAYGNTSSGTIMFGDGLTELADGSQNRFSVDHVLSAPSMWSSFEYWRRGIIDAEAVNAFLEAHPPYAQDAQYYICGPGGMNPAVKTALMGLDVPAERIHMESYGGEIEQDMSFEGIAATATVSLDGRTMDIPVDAGQTILNAVRNAGGNPKFSCQSGVCGACRARLREGDVHLRARMALTDTEVDAGAILTCQAVAKSHTLTVSYD